MSCVFCDLDISTRQHHIVPRMKGGKVTVAACCEEFIHRTWTHNELRDTYNNVETIRADPKFQRFLKWRLKQHETAYFPSATSNSRKKRNN
jgi:hypothetical protein